MEVFKERNSYSEKKKEIHHQSLGRRGREEKKYRDYLRRRRWNNGDSLTLKFERGKKGEGSFDKNLKAEFFSRVFTGGMMK